MRNAAGYDNFHTGVGFLSQTPHHLSTSWLIGVSQRGGEGNIYKEKYGGHSAAPAHEKEKDKESLGDKVKHLFGKKD